MMISFLKAVLSFFTTAVLVYLAILFPGWYMQLGQQAPPPFDISREGIYLSNPPVQLLIIGSVLLVPALVAYAFFILHKRQVDSGVYAALSFYGLYLLLLGHVYFVML